MGALHELLTDHRAASAVEYVVLLAAAAVFAMTVCQVSAHAIGALMALISAAWG